MKIELPVVKQYGSIDYNLVMYAMDFADGLEGHVHYAKFVLHEKFRQEHLSLFITY